MLRAECSSFYWQTPRVRTGQWLVQRHKARACCVETQNLFLWSANSQLSLHYLVILPGSSTKTKITVIRGWPLIIRHNHKVSTSFHIGAFRQYKSRGQKQPLSVMSSEGDWISPSLFLLRPFNSDTDGEWLLKVKIQCTEICVDILRVWLSCISLGLQGSTLAGLPVRTEGMNQIIPGEKQSCF